jgi:hypothetical protein
MWPGFMQAAQVVGEVVSSGHRHTRATRDTEESGAESRPVCIEHNYPRRKAQIFPLRISLQS